MPFLLKALDDKRPTKLTVRSSFDYGHEKENYTVKIGDVCYVVLGQIVGESYHVVYYIPSGIVGIYSPTEHPELVKDARKQWSSDDPSQALYKKLLTDYEKKPVFNGKNLNGWYVRLQIESAMRLLYYFPQQSVSKIAGRLQRLNVDAPGLGNEWMKREVSNGVRTTDFIKAVMWSKEPVIRKALAGIYRRTTDVDIFLLVLPVVDTTEVRSASLRIKSYLAELPQSEDSETGYGHELLIALATHDGNDAKVAYKQYMQNASLQRQWTMCRVLREVQKGWAIEFLGPMLDDKRTGFGDDFPVKG